MAPKSCFVAVVVRRSCGYNSEIKNERGEMGVTEGKGELGGAEERPVLTPSVLPGTDRHVQHPFRSSTAFHVP